MKIITYRFVSYLTTIALLVIVFSDIKAQSTTPPASIKYIRMDIGHGALHCPFLSPKLETELKKVKDINNFFIDRKASYITFELPSDTEVTNEILKKIGTDVGYPTSDVMVSMDTKPIVPATPH